MLRVLFLNFGTPSISGMGIARDFKFGVRIDRQACITKNAKVGQKVRGLLLVTSFYNFGTPSISLNWVWLDTSNSVCGLTARPTNQKCKSRSKGRCGGG